GGTTDILGRMVAAGLAPVLGQPVVVENRPGQAGSVGSAELARAAPDGYTVGGGTISSHAINVSLYPSLPYDPLKDFAPITMLADLLAETIQLSFENITSAYPQVKGGRLKALAVTSAKRSFVAPEVPAMAEAGLAGYDISSWQAMFAPAGTPQEIVSRLNAET